MAPGLVPKGNCRAVAYSDRNVGLLFDFSGIRNVTDAGTAACFARVSSRRAVFSGTIEITVGKSRLTIMAAVFTLFGELKADTGAFKNSLRDAEARLKATERAIEQTEAKAKKIGMTSATTAR